MLVAILMLIVFVLSLRAFTVILLRRVQAKRVPQEEPEVAPTRPDELATKATRLVVELTSGKASLLMAELIGDLSQAAELEREYSSAIAAGWPSEMLENIAIRYCDVVLHGLDSYKKALEEIDPPRAALRMLAVQALLDGRDPAVVQEIVDPVSQLLEPLSDASRVFLAVDTRARKAIADLQRTGRYVENESEQLEYLRAASEVLDQKSKLPRGDTALRN